MSRVHSALLASLFFAASTAHAEGRFGKKDTVHAATPVGGEPQQDEGTSSSDCSGDCEHEGHGNPLVTFLLAWGGALHGHDLRVAPVAPPPQTEPVEVASLNEAAEVGGNLLAASHGRPANPGFALRVDGLAVSEGGGLQLGVGTEGRRWGALADVTALWLKAEGGAPGTDRLQLANLHATFSPYANPSFRLRLEAGLDSARGPDAQFFGLGLGGSLEGCLLGALDGELRATATVLPYTSVDARAGLALRLAAVSVRMGLRVAYLNDRGLTVPGDPHSDTLIGPYVGLGLSL